MSLMDFFRNLPDKDTGFGTTDGYFILHSSTDGGKTKTKLFRSDTINDKENPDWGTVYEFDFDRAKNQVIPILIKLKIV